MTDLIVHRGGPHMTVQDMGRPGFLAQGVARGGAMDRLALAEGAALLGQSTECAAIEMAGSGGVFQVTDDTRIALTGAPMRAEIDGGTLAWNASRMLPKGARITIGGAIAGTYGYLHFGGGFATPPQLGARATHLSAGLGQTLDAGTHLPLGADTGTGEVGFTTDVDDRFNGGTVRIVPSLQTALFPESERARFEATVFRRDPRSNRMGARLTSEGDGFSSEAGLSVLSEVITPGDIQITGDGTPFVLMAECQTTGGYPRIGTVIPADLPKVAQAGRDAELRFEFIEMAEAVAVERGEASRLKGLPRHLRRLVRRPEEMRDLLAYQLVSGVTRGDDLERSPSLN
jgi:allophanate hydrolase